MVNRNLIRGLDLTEEEWQQELDSALEGTPPEEWFQDGDDVAVNQIVDGRVLRVEGDFVLVDVGYKSEGMIPRSEWEEDEEPPRSGQNVKVLIEDIEDASAKLDESRGMIDYGRTPAFNPGSEYGEGVLRGLIVAIKGGEVVGYQFTSG